jgi:hypothetical protein
MALRRRRRWLLAGDSRETADGEDGGLEHEVTPMTRHTLTIPDSTPSLTPLPRAGRTRRLLACVLLPLLLVACGGGGGAGGGGLDRPPPTGPVQPPPVTAPSIQEFASDKAAYFVGESATLTVRFTDGTGRIEGYGPVTSGTPFRTPALDSTVELRLVVESPNGGGSVARTLRLPVDYRNAYRAVPGEFRSSGHTATLAGDGRVVIVGGSRAEGTASFSIDAYDPATGGFRRLGTLQNGRMAHAATRLPDGRILVTGGEIALANPAAELIDERTGATTAIGAPRVRRISHTATYIGGNRVLLVGGTSAGENAPYGVSDTAEIFDAATGQFRLLTARLNMRRTNHSAVWMPDGRVLILGGLTAPGTRYEFAEVFDPRTGTFAVAALVDNRERGLHATAALPDGRVLVLGGETGDIRAVSHALRVDPSLTSATLADLLRPRTLVEAVVVRDGRAFLFGGQAGPALAFTETAESYSAATGPAPIASLPEPRGNHTATRLNDGRILIVGGENAAGDVTTALLYE